MSVASKLGRGVGKAVGWTAATAYKGAVMACEATGEFGSEAYEAMTDSFDERCAQLDAKRDERKARLLALKAQQQPGAITVVA